VIIHVSPSILNDLSFILIINVSIVLNFVGYNNGIMPSMIRIREKTKATISIISIF